MSCMRQKKENGLKLRVGTSARWRGPIRFTQTKSTYDIIYTVLYTSIIKTQKVKWYEYTQILLYGMSPATKPGLDLFSYSPLLSFLPSPNPILMQLCLHILH